MFNLKYDTDEPLTEYKKNGKWTYCFECVTVHTRIPKITLKISNLKLLLRESGLKSQGFTHRMQRQQHYFTHIQSTGIFQQSSVKPVIVGVMASFVYMQSGSAAFQDYLTACQWSLYL